MSLRLTSRLVLILMLVVCCSRAAAAMNITWDRSSLQLIQRGGGYARMTRLRTGLLCCFERRGQCCVRRSLDNGKTWQDAVPVVGYQYGFAANPELLACRDGRVMLFYNGRPREVGHPFVIGMAVSSDEGVTWKSGFNPLFTAGSIANTGCYEPAAIQLSSGEIELFFANEFPYKNGEQEISMMQSSDGGHLWTAARTVSFRRHCRDGMPVPIILRDGRGIVTAIEDNGLTGDHQLKPAIIKSLDLTGWTGPAVPGDSTGRWGAVDAGWKAGSYAGAPYLRQLFTGETVLSCQSDQTRGRPRMVVFIGDPEAKHFGDPTEPFPLDDNAKGLWNSLFVKDRATIVALSTTTIGGVPGVWAIDGHIARP